MTFMLAYGAFPILHIAIAPSTLKKGGAGRDITDIGGKS
jgi:hypothetical protein